MMLSLEFEGVSQLYNIVSVEQVNRAAVDALYNHGLDSVPRLQERFSDVLQPGADEDVGASGKAARNLTSQWSFGEWRIQEGSTTRANRIIREGLPPGSKVPIQKLRMWAANKGVKLYYDEASDPGKGRVRTPNAVLDKIVSQNGTLFTRSRWFGRVGIKRHSALKPSDVATKGLYALRYALFMHGTQRPSANWYNLMPSGRGRFDYGRYVMKKDQSIIKDIIKDLGVHIAEDVGMAILKKGT